MSMGNFFNYGQNRTINIGKKKSRIVFREYSMNAYECPMPVDIIRMVLKALCRIIDTRVMFEE